VLAAAYCFASFVLTDFNLYKLQTGTPKAMPVLREIMHPDLSWHAHDMEGNPVLNQRTGQPKPGTLQLLLDEMNETVMTSLAGTLLAVLLSFPLCFFAAGNLMRSPAGRVAYAITRAVFNVTRAFPPYILAIVFVIIVGTGPFAGVLALAVHSVGMLGKLFAEAIEGIDPAPVEAVRATGAGRFLTVWFGILPQVASQFVAFSLYRMDMNIRMSIILGIVGAGGIGFLLEQYIRQFKYSQASTAFLIILAAVTLLDWASSWLREKLD
jgi:phosphonate transport system permease protein